MMITGTFALTGWDEDVLEGSPTKVTSAVIGQSWKGSADGEVTCRTLMHYAADETATIVGLLRFTGSVDGRRGSFVTACSGSFDGTTVQCDLQVVPGSGTGDLSGAAGTGSFAAPKGPEGTWSLDLA